MDRPMWDKIKNMEDLSDVYGLDNEAAHEKRTKTPLCLVVTVGSIESINTQIW